MKKEKKLELKKIHDSAKDIQTRLAKGKPTTFAERSWLKMQEKAKEKGRKGK